MALRAALAPWCFLLALVAPSAVAEDTTTTLYTTTTWTTTTWTTTTLTTTTLTTTTLTTTTATSTSTRTSTTMTTTTTVTEPRAADPGPGARTVRILHLSDTHNMHRDIERLFGPMPAADILLHTGDVSTWGTDKELEDANAWFGELKARYANMLAITGNHDWVEPLRQVQDGRLSPRALLDPALMQRKLSNIRLLSDELVVVRNLKIYGSAWSPWYGNMHVGDMHEAGWYEGARASVLGAWGGASNLQASFPRWVDVLMTHNPAHGLFDQVEASAQWGSSEGLRRAIVEQTPKVHLFGHVHEQRGLWQRGADGGFAGGVEYQAVPGSPYLPMGPPPPSYPVQVVSNNAMMNQPGVEFALTGRGKDVYRIAAPPRLIIATWADGRWTFKAEPAGR